MKKRRQVERSGTARPEDLEILDFAYRWVAFGGPPSAEIFIAFGIRTQVFWYRTKKALKRVPEQEYCPVRRNELAALVAERERRVRAARAVQARRAKSKRASVAPLSGT